MAFWSAVILALSALLVKRSENYQYKYANYSGDIMLAGIFPIHLFDERITCGEIQDQDGVQLLETMMFTLDEINKKGILPFRLGGIVMDSCDNDASALKQVANVIKVFAHGFDGGNSMYRCNDGTEPIIDPSLQEFKKVKGVIGGSTSEVTMTLASFLQLLSIPQISYQSTSPDLSNRERYTHFLRTVPSDVYQAKAIVAILKAFNWQYVSVVYEETNYGIKGVSALDAEIVGTGICFNAKEKIIVDANGKDSKTATHKGLLGPAEQYRRIMKRLLQKNHAKVVIIYARDIFAYQLFLVADEMNIPDRFMWLGSDAWSNRKAVVKGVELVVRDAITVRPQSIPVTGFEEYFNSLDPLNNARDPWFKEFWENHFECSFSKAQKNVSVCTGSENIGGKGGFIMSVYSSMVHDAVYAFAHALANMYNETCGAPSGQICDKMSTSKFNGNDLLRFLRSVKFPDSSGRMFEFINGVDGMPRYSINTFTRDKNGQYNWVEVGTYFGNLSVPGYSANAQLTFYKEFNDTVVRNIPPSRCAETCTINQATRYTELDKCCWICQNCSENEFVEEVNDDVDEEQACKKCQPGNWPYVNRTGCYALPLEHAHYSSTWSIIAFSLSAFGIILEMIVAVIFFIYRETPVIRASGKESNFVLLIGILLSFLSSWLFLSKPTVVTCVLIRFMLGTCYTTCYAALLVKTNRIVRIFSVRTEGFKQVKYTTPKYQFAFIFFLVLVEEVIISAWSLAVLRRPLVVTVYPTTKSSVLICYDANGFPYLLVLAYPFLLVISCAVYAFKARRTPDGFNESRNLGFCAYTTCVIWLAFTSIYFGTPNYILSSFVIGVSVTLSAMVELICIFIPKIYIVIMKPELNTRAAVMTRNPSHLNSVSVSYATDGKYEEINISRAQSDSNSKNTRVAMISNGTVSSESSLLSTSPSRKGSETCTKYNASVDLSVPETRSRRKSEPIHSNKQSYGNMTFELSLEDQDNEKICNQIDDNTDRRSKSFGLLETHLGSIPTSDI